MVEMIASMETYLRRGRRTCQRLLLNPKIRTGGVVLLCGGSGFLLSAASLGNYPQPLAMGLILAMSGWHAAVMSLGAMLGYWVFWGIAGLQGLVWSASGGLLALLLARHIPEEQPLIFPAISAFLTALTGLLFQLVLRDTVPVPVYFLRIVLAAGAGLLFPVALRRRTAVTDWLVGGAAVLALAQASPTPYLGLGYLAAGALAVGSAFPAAVLGGLGLDLAQVTNIPMTAVLCLAGVIRMIPFERKWMRCLAPGAACMVVMAICGIRDYTPLPGLILGGGLGILMPPSQETARRRGETGLAQVRLELGAEVLGVTQQLFLETAPPPVDASAVLQKDGVPPLILADGPAGLRVSREYFMRDGRLIPLPLERCFESGYLAQDCPEPDGEKFYQFCTAFPIGTMLAQSWDTALLQAVGRAVGREMEVYRVALWLAPGMNLHRDPLCGRNFEYFSEDPLLSGRMAAAMTAGVQSVPGRGTTVKHFACNNLENDRVELNSIVSERALRELYLKGFEIALRSPTPPAAVMTAYNLVNGVHAANSYALCTVLAREEWGYRGVLMTDWDSTGSRRCTAVGCMLAGNELLMPGCRRDYDELLDAVRAGKLPRAALQQCAARVIAAARQLQR